MTDLIGAPAAGAESVDRIRDIIFGTQMRDYEQRFEAVLRDLARLQQETAQLGERLTSQAAAATKSLQALRSDMQQSQSDMRAEANQGLARLGNQLSEQDSNQGQQFQELRQELHRADEDLRAELRQTAQRLAADKTDRALLGDLFVELGNHIKAGGALSDLLKGLDQTA